MEDEIIDLNLSEEILLICPECTINIPEIKIKELIEK